MARHRFGRGGVFLGLEVLENEFALCGNCAARLLVDGRADDMRELRRSTGRLAVEDGCESTTRTRSSLSLFLFARGEMPSYSAREVAGGGDLGSEGRACFGGGLCDGLEANFVIHVDEALVVAVELGGD